MVTIKDVAKRANVAVSTASYALNGVKKVSEETRRKVLQAAEELNYRKNGFAADLKKSKTQTIALILSDLSGPFYSELIRGVQDIAVDHGYDLIACNSLGGQNSTAAKFLTERRVDGCIILAHNITNEMIEKSASPAFPIVLLDRQLERAHTVPIIVDNKNGGYKATTFLIQKGHNNIAFIGGPADSHDGQMRFEGYLEALQEHHIDFQSRWKVTGNFTREGGELAAKIIAAQDERPTAIFVANDEMALGAMEYFQKVGIRVPEDISIIGFDNILESKYTAPKLTTVQHPKYEMGALASHVIFQLLDGEETEKSFTLHTELIMRETVIDIMTKLRG
ncbi:LacI family transcriptional regulator [Pullulanibacillus camelliae]|uniref:LacI family transcriptional regulator n=1 Tax=Pullulanibacillus camelliae TaxID=1707096 RepID=A0A8J2YEQ0_9BACL|nr:LacI family DNA-binding transcriptional regulator [Pullulanibacillus camelliae]GGE26230.1 LacI family transcriptional regulator [Pullulanibacillus camelliae]